MSDGGKGSKPRPFSIPTKKFEENWNRIFKPEDNTGTSKNEYYDQLSTEDCLTEKQESQ